MYDYIIVGAGPTGLTIAWCLAQYNKKVLIIEREKELGGCHRVRRVDGLFTEHGPRIYLGNSKTFNFILDDMKFSFDTLFTKYKFNGINIASQVFKIFKINEFIAVITSYLYFIVRPQFSKTQTMDAFMTAHNFEQPSRDFIDKLCRITDGAGSDRYTLYEFLQIINQNIFYNIYQPKLPNDIGLFKQWHDALINTGLVDIWLNSEVLYIDQKDTDNTHKKLLAQRDDNTNLITDIFVTRDGVMTQIKCNTCIFAIPPKALISILSKNPSTRDAFGNFDEFFQWQLNTNYLLFIPVVFHWDTKIEVEQLWGIPASDWGIGSIVLSDYTDFKDSRSKTVITTSITMAHKYSKYLNKTPHECTKNELIEEVFRQLKEIYANTDLKRFTSALISPEMYRKNNKWISRDSAFVLTTEGYKKSQSVKFKNLYSVGTHNGNNFYNFTSIESAVSNGVACVNELIPESKKKYKIIKFITINDIIVFFFIILALCLIYKKIYRK